MKPDLKTRHEIYKSAYEEMKRWERFTCLCVSDAGFRITGDSLCEPDIYPELFMFKPEGASNYDAWLSKNFGGFNRRTPEGHRLRLTVLEFCIEMTK